MPAAAAVRRRAPFAPVAETTAAHGLARGILPPAPSLVPFAEVSRMPVAVLLVVAAIVVFVGGIWINDKVTKD